MRIAGIMSGTSLDGIDVAVIDIDDDIDDETLISTVAHFTTPYSDEIRERIIAISNRQCHTRDLSRLHFALSELYAQAVRATCDTSNTSLESIHLVGCHGQTVYHEGEGVNRNTLQLGEAAVLAERLGIPVVSNFRARDIAAGGKGAPLVPFLDELLFSHPSKHRVALNIGGIANITVLAPGKPVIAFDTGPGNMIIDQLVEMHTDHKQRFDRDGVIAAQGRIDRDLLGRLLEDPYFAAAPPKTAGREQYGTALIDTLVKSNRSMPDLIATATAFTAASIAQGINSFGEGAQEVIAAGGGIHNSQLMTQLAVFLPQASINTTADFGIDPDAKEAIAFALLAYRTWRRSPGNLPSATGARRAVILGDITLAT